MRDGKELIQNEGEEEAEGRGSRGNLGRWGKEERNGGRKEVDLGRKEGRANRGSKVCKTLRRGS